jgi:hypothetical protein
MLISVQFLPVANHDLIVFNAYAFSLTGKSALDSGKIESRFTPLAVLEGTE